MGSRQCRVGLSTECSLCHTRPPPQKKSEKRRDSSVSCWHVRFLGMCGKSSEWLINQFQFNEEKEEKTN